MAINPYLYDAIDDLEHSPIYAYPKSCEDRRNAKIIDGFWVPGRFVQYVDGQPCIAGEREPLNSGKEPTTS